MAKSTPVDEVIKRELQWKERRAAAAHGAKPPTNGAAKAQDGARASPGDAHPPGDGAVPAGSRLPVRRDQLWFVDPKHSLCGLALSGGGIRSATFNLGLLQGLQQLGVLKYFDYLATVSGGGYIGGFWTAWRHYHARQGEFFPSGGARQGARGADLAEVRHLREFSNFLVPRLGLLSADTGRLIVAVVSAVVPALLAVLSFILLVLMAWVVAAGALFSGRTLYALAPGFLTCSWGVMLVLTLTGLGLAEAHRLREEARARLVREVSKELEPPGALSALSFYVITMVVATAGVLLVWRWLGPESNVWARWYSGVWMAGLPLRQGGSVVSNVFHPSLAWAVAAGGLVMVRWFLSRFLVKDRQQEILAAMDRVTSRLLLLAAIWAVIAGFWVVGRMLAIDLQEPGGLSSSKTVTAFVGLVTALTALFARAQQLLGRQANKPTSPGALERLKPLIPQFLAYAVLVLLVLGLMLLLFRAETGGWLRYLVGTAGGISVLVLCLFDPNRVGLHAFYRSRIARAYIGAAHGQGPGQTEPHPKDHIRLDKLEQVEGPVHLLCCAANDLSSEDPMANLYRGAESAVLSPVGFSVGRLGQKLDWVSWDELPPDDHHMPSLAAAMTASGAALNSHMGSMSMKLGRAVTFLMTAFNLRLGMWWPHPGNARRKWYERVFVGLPFYKELLGWSRASGRDVLLSDGGHFENLALYELIRRRCRYVVLSDCGMDADNSFNDFANAVRRVREDFGVEIRIDLSPLRPEGPNGLARQPMVAGDIEYPGGDTGVLLMFKPTLVGNEPSDIAQYKRRNAAFPHETTGDQFYDEAQWESYRRLGEHAALSAFRHVLVREQTQKEALQQVVPGESEAQKRARRELERQAKDPRELKSEFMEERAGLFASARYEWLPMPVGYEERFSRLVARASELDMLLQNPDLKRLFQQVFKEITELDEQAKVRFRRQAWLKDLGRRWRPSSGRRLAWKKRLGPESSGWAVGAPRPSSKDVQVSLHMIRRALLIMEDVFLSEKLEANYNHPAYLGIINYFARWAYAPLFRMWWPMLKTLYPLRFTRFLEEQFALPGMERKDLGELTLEDKGFAMSCWAEQRGRRLGEADRERIRKQKGKSWKKDESPWERFISYQLNLPYSGVPRYHVQAAQVLVRIKDAKGQDLIWDSDGYSGMRLLVWDADEFYVPPGLWGSGIGEDFLHLLITNCTRLEELKGVDALAVRIVMDPDGLPANRKRGADEMQLYRSRGFSDPWDPGLSQYLHALPVGSPSARGQPHWLVRPVAPSARVPAQRVLQGGTPPPEDVSPHHH